MTLKLFLAFLVVSSTITASPNNRRVLTEQQMRKLALAGVRARAPAALKLRGFELDRQPDSSGYVVFMAMVDVGEGNEGFYAIDPRTGDMWDAVSECGAISSTEIQRLQHIYRKQLRLSPTDYLKIKRKGPICDQES